MQLGRAKLAKAFLYTDDTLINQASAFDNLRTSLLEPTIQCRLGLLNHCLDSLGHLANTAKIFTQFLECVVQLFQLRPQAEYTGLEVALECERQAIAHLFN